MLRVLTIAASCVVLTATATAAADTSFRATGNEPSWRLDIGASEMTLLTNFGQDRLVVPTPKALVSGTTTKYAARTDKGDLTATIVDQLCVDSMSGMPHPQSVTVVVGGKTLTGCGGEPASLLQGAEWKVEEIGGASLVAGSNVTLDFTPDGRVSGHASSNSFRGTYALTGEGLTFSRMAGTRMICEAALMDQERRFLDAMGAVQNFSITADGALLLNTGDGRPIKAQRR